ncbi:hypothetical protein A9A72_124553 [Stutzerimonas stutzeri]|jgi:hypothetical protein|uniref:Uncharacterized protein n=1 Tax=Stutzerimonas stutzeri TaxID=316 RepID=A0A5S5B7R1_STUST|nr:hypothetical protein A9A72_124553 [Stutzerimonas stutzeri]
MILSLALHYVPKDTVAEPPDFPCRCEIAREPDPSRRHGSPASWLLQKSTRVAARRQTCRSELAREPAAPRRYGGAI